MAGVDEALTNWRSVLQKHLYNHLHGTDVFVRKEYLLQRDELLTKQIAEQSKINGEESFVATHMTLRDGQPLVEVVTKNSTKKKKEKLDANLRVIPSSLLKLMLQGSSRVTVEQLYKCIDVTHKDKYFICRVITVPLIMVSVQLIADVPCPENDLAVRVALYNYTDQRTNLGCVFTIGTKLIIVNPFLKSTNDGGLSLTSYSRLEVFTISDELLASKFPDLKWPDLPGVFKAAEESIPNRVKLEDLKKMGNDHFVKGKFEDAVDYYSRALENDPRNETLLSNRAAAHLRLEKYLSAMVDAESVLSRNPLHPKANYRCAKAYIALEKYDSAITLLENNVGKSTASDFKECRLLLAEAYKLKHEKGL